MHPMFEKLLEPIQDKSIPLGDRLFYASREMVITKQANEELTMRGDTVGVKVGQEYLRALERVIERIGAAALGGRGGA